ncbi:shieldin complex subunit 1 isoform X4 [Rhinolophus sinicus]|uniref:shieldin complex subunit 1 isoform X4 n=1 Tax=Rhinolophus sinicus TaxID=89399 RepID=UPI003D78C244
MAPPLPGFRCAGVAGRTMATQEVPPGSQAEESSALDLPSSCDIRDYVLQRPSQEAHSEAFSSVETFSLPSSSDVDPAFPGTGEWVDRTLEVLFC